MTQQYKKSFFSRRMMLERTGHFLGVSVNIIDTKYNEQTECVFLTSFRVSELEQKLYGRMRSLIWKRNAKDRSKDSID